MAISKNIFAINGWLIVDKPVGMTSTSVVNTVRKSFKAAKVGHGGTLDPLATGVLPLAFGEATKTLRYVFDGTKEYKFTLRWGESRNTDDADGPVTGKSDKRPNEKEILSILERFTGEIDQVPPKFSALKVGGRRAYDLARDNKDFKLEPRKIKIFNFTLIEILDSDYATFRVVSGKGTYIRSLARDVALALGTRGHVTQLRRIRVGPFLEKDAISLDKLFDLRHTAPANKLMWPVEAALDDIPALALNEREARKLKCGQSISTLNVAEHPPLKGLRQGDILLAKTGGKPVALACFENDVIRPFRVLNL